MTAQFSELKTLVNWTHRAREHDVQVMIEGPGHNANAYDQGEYGPANGSV